MTLTLTGYTDATPTLTKIDTLSAEHIRQTIYRAVRTRRGTDREYPDRWTDIGDLVGAVENADALRAALAGVAFDLLETDERISDLRFTVSIPSKGMLAWRATAQTSAGVVVIEGDGATLPQDEPDPPALTPIVLTRPNIRTVLLGGRVLPAHMSKIELGRLVYAVGLVCDAYVDWVVRAMQQRFPLICEPDALLWHGRDRQIFRGQVQSEASFRAQLVRWLQLHKRRGHPWALLTAIQTYFSTDPSAASQGPLVRCVEHHPHPSGTSRAIWCSLDPLGVFSSHEQSPSNWDWDSNDPLRPASVATKDTRFWVLVYQAAGTTPPALFAEQGDSSPALPSSSTIAQGSSLSTKRHVQDIATLGRFWRGAGAWFAGLILVYDPAAFAPTGTGVLFPDGDWYRNWNPDTLDYQRDQRAAYCSIRRHPTLFDDAEPTSDVP